MAMDMYTLYAEAAASFLLHGALIFAIVLLLRNLQLTELTASFYIGFATLVAFGSFVINGGLLTILHQLTCSGVRNVSGILTGAGVSAIISTAMSLLPFFIEPLRLVVSQIVMTHRYLATPSLLEAESTLKTAATHVQELAISAGTLAPEIRAPVGEGVGSLPAAEYAIQTLQEARVAASYLAAFGGAYGMALGAHWTSDCKKSS
jgi:hypothetical protein